MDQHRTLDPSITGVSMPGRLARQFPTGVADRAVTRDKIQLESRQDVSQGISEQVICIPSEGFA